MKRLYEGVSAASVVFFLIIVVGGFLFGTKTHKDKSRHHRKVEEKVEKAKKEKDDFHKKNNLSRVEELEHERNANAEELEYLRKMNDPLWHYYDSETLRYEPVPGKYRVDTPKRPRKEYVY